MGKNRDNYLSYLSPEQAESIRIYFVEKCFVQAEVAKKIGMTSVSISRALNGHQGMNKTSGKKLYELLGEDSRFSFLLDLSKKENRHILYDAHWRGIYKQHADKLQDIYLKSSLETKGKILSELEKIAQSY